jgi:hypothetical protein
MDNQNLLKIFEEYLKYEREINEATVTSNVGNYRAPLSPGLKIWKNKTLAPFVDELSNYYDAELNYDSLDGDIETVDARKKEVSAEKISLYNEKHPSLNDDDGDILNQYFNKTRIKNNISKPFVSEADTSITAGMYNGPLEIGLKKWRKSELGPFTEFSDNPVNLTKKQKTLKNNIKKTVGVWEKHPEDGYEIPTHEVDTINEDLAVWFGTKKKPKGSKQPKGPWVNICRKDKDGKHPPCGRPEAHSKGYPKCRAAGVAGKMSDAQKKSACAQKRRAEKKHNKTGTGNKPVMVSHKKKKTNESVLIQLIRKYLD